jgi:cobalt-precorrin-5B (C1)-methyltransferase
MIHSAVAESYIQSEEIPGMDISISVKDGELLAQKTLNERLGIIGGLSILGTTGIVRPVSASAWTDTIEVAMNVARAAGLQEVLLSTGRTSETAAQASLQLPEEALVMMGDYLEFSLLAAKKQGFQKIHFAGMWAKIMKAALHIPQTHVRHGALDMAQAAKLLTSLGLPKQHEPEFAAMNTAREMYLVLNSMQRTDIIKKVCIKARDYAADCAGLPVSLYLTNSEQGLVLHV